LAERFHLVVIDLPGFSQSEGRIEMFPAGDGSFLVRLVREWDLGPVHLVGPDVGTSAA
jgi:pimeloyl-ACP methyl ester carboxylesterase